MKYLALCLALGKGEGLGLKARLPVLVPLSAYANTLADKDISLSRFLTQHYLNRGIELPIEGILKETMALGGALILLDGLDEVRSLRDRLIVVRRVIDFFNFHRQKGNKFILTSRIVGYREVRPNVKGLLECTLVDFEEEEIKNFVDKWTSALEKAARGDTEVALQEAAREKSELLDAVHRNPGVRRLAANPLLLTILALMKRQGITLPDRRVELYQKYVETLLKNWNLARGLDRPPMRELDLIETGRILAPLALWMHETNPGAGLVKQKALRRKLEEIYAERKVADPETAAHRFITDVREHTGLLLERGHGEYGFIHLTFQEYLAAVAVAQLGQRELEPVIKVLERHVGDENWHEVALLIVAYMGIIQQRDEAAAEVVQGLCESREGKPGEATVLAGEAVADAWPGGVTTGSKEKVMEALLGAMTDRDGVSPIIRVSAGNALARLGDPRFREDVLYLPDDDNFGFLEIPKGTFFMGTDEEEIPRLMEKLGGKKDWYEGEIPQHEPFVDTFFMSVYPVTVAQFKAFVEKSGHKPADEDCLKGLTNHPVVYVTWYDAMAYCEWLTAKLREEVGASNTIRDKLLRDGWVVRLPTEAEWEKAARGNKNARIFPWGNEPDPDKANYNETGINSTSAVGCFPKGASPYGILDMSGNVWEWTVSLWGKDIGKPDFRYPYKPGSERENLKAGRDVLRVLRGGAFDYSRRSVRCAYRFRHDPNDWSSYYVGFRVVLAPRLNSEL